MKLQSSLKSSWIAVEIRVFLALTLGLAVIVAAAVYTAAAGVQLADQRRGLLEQDQGVRALQQLRNAMQRAENAQRTHLLIAHPADLDAFIGARAQAEQALRRLQTLAPGDGEQQRHAEAAGARLAELQAALDLQQIGARDAALRIARDTDGWQRAQALDQQLALELDRHNALLEQGERTADRQQRHTWTGTVLLIALAGLFLTGVNFTILRQLSERRQLLQRLKFEASHDVLTGLPNRRHFIDWCGYALGRVRRDGARAAVLYLDLDGFKAINDQVGHEAGDRALAEVADRFRKTLRDADLVARLGGDEFAVLAPAIATADEAATLAGRMIDALAQPLLPEYPDLAVGLSVGVAIYPDSGSRIEELLEVADAAMYQAKRSGRNRYRVHRSDPAQPVERADILMHDLYRAVEQREFRVLYQPQVDLVSGALVGAEALLRWQHPTLGLIGPEEFIDLAERGGAILAIGDWLLDEVARQLAEWRERSGFRTRISVNLTSRQLRSGRVARRIGELMQRYQLPPDTLEIELVERSFIDPQASLELPRLKQLGLRVVIDDFGTGYSSLGALKQFAIDGIKIDRSFVDGLPNESFDCELTRSMCALAHNLGLDVVAEGVENRQQADFLRACGCRVAQGWLYSEALPAGQLAGWRNGMARPALVRQRP